MSREEAIRAMTEEEAHGREPCVLLGVTGCIAAYKSCEIVRALQRKGVRVKVVMTEHAAEFVGATTFRALTHEPVAVGLFDEPGDPVHHVSLARECDAFLVAPATANVIAKMAAGIADDLLTTTALAVNAPVLVAPAMNTSMYEAAATRENIATLSRRGVAIIEPCEGRLACGDVGKGHLADVDNIVEETMDVLRRADATDASSETGTKAASGDLAGMSVMVTAGPTVEPIDAVRFISNYSSGKMGYAIARAAARRGAHVDLVSGPVSLDAPADVHVVNVRTAREMLDAAREPFDRADVAFFTAAVSDFRPAQTSPRKLKKGADGQALSLIELVENPDVLATLAQDKHAGQYVVGFAAETEDVVDHAKEKLASKGADMIVANEVGPDKTFGADDSEAWLVDAAGERGLGIMGKDALADAILDAVRERM